MSRMSELMPEDGYPSNPGFKIHGPSESAARTMRGSAAQLRAKVLARIAEYPSGATADEVAKDLDLSVLSVRPRVSELRRNGDIRQTPQRRRNASGMTATVWQAVVQKSGEGSAT